MKNLGPRSGLGASLEEAQTLNIGGHNLPTILYQQAGNSGGLYNSTANYSFNYAPDLLAKLVYEPGYRPLRALRHRPLLPRPCLSERATRIPRSSTLTAADAFTAKTEGGGAA